MRIAYVLPGSGDTFYCQNCVRDITLVRALKRRGHDVVLVPLYLPLFADDQELADDVQVFFGGLSTYLQQEYALFRKTPRWIDRILDARPLLRRLAKRSGSTKASDLGDMTVSMLMGEEGNQSKEVTRLVGWLKETIKPDLVHLSTSLLLGIVPALKRELDVKCVCSLQDEDLWVDSMKPADSGRVWQLMSGLARQVDMFAAVSRYYADLMSRRLNLSADKMEVVYPGIHFEDYSVADKMPDVPVIGYLSRLSASLGFDLIVEAFLELKKSSRWKGLKLKITGGRTSDDRAAASRVMNVFEKAGVAGDVEFLWTFDRAARIEFLKSLSVLSVPSARGEAFGLHIVEALACGVPVVQPRSGAYTELVELTGGGMLCEPASRSDLVSVLEKMLSDPEAARHTGRTGRENVAKLFTTESVVAGMLRIYERIGGEV